MLTRSVVEVYSPGVWWKCADQECGGGVLTRECGGGVLTRECGGGVLMGSVVEVCSSGSVVEVYSPLLKEFSTSSHLHCKV